MSWNPIKGGEYLAHVNVYQIIKKGSTAWNY